MRITKNTMASKGLETQSFRNSSDNTIYHGQIQIKFGAHIKYTRIRIYVKFQLDMIKRFQTFARHCTTQMNDSPIFHNLYSIKSGFSGSMGPIGPKGNRGGKFKLKLINKLLNF